MEWLFTNSKDFKRAYNCFDMIADNLSLMSMESVDVEVGGANNAESRQFDLLCRHLAYHFPHI